MSLRALGVCLVAVLLAFSGAVGVREGWLTAKAALADVLIRGALAKGEASGRAPRPWPWADTYPLARLEVPRLGVERWVLSGASGTSLAFGVGHVDGTSLPNEAGTCVLAGHRDGRFAFLEELRPGDELVVTARNASVRYRVTEAAVVDARRTWRAAPTPRPRVVLVTCYPFEGLAGGPLRYAVCAEPAVSPE
jgi:sortase A